MSPWWWPFLALYAAGMTLAWWHYGVRLPARRKRRYWEPFTRTMRAVADLDLEADEPARLPRTGTPEVDALVDGVNDVLGELHDRYHIRKQFTENASHELQTPLAVIQANAELLLQQEGLGETEADLVAGIRQAARRLTRINKGLILLSRIDNLPAEDFTDVDVAAMLDEILEDYREAARWSRLAIRETFDGPVVRHTSESLMGILLANLLRNAVRHNVPGGWIELHLDADGLTVRNTGAPLEGEPARLFQRFARAGKSEESVGLGLAIAERIAWQLDFAIRYDFEEAGNVHALRVAFGGWAEPSGRRVPAGGGPSAEGGTPEA
jgi:signal transduction histidine kinase